MNRLTLKLYGKLEKITVLNNNNLVKENHIFAGWNTKADGTGITYQENHTFQITKNTTLYAKWDINPNAQCTVTYDSRGGNSIDSQTVAYGSTITKPQNPIREGYVFVGWYIEETSKTNERLWDFSKDIVTDNITLYAKWEVEKASVTPAPPTTPTSSNAALTVKTGDNNNILLMFSLITVSGLGLLITSFLIRNRAKKLNSWE